METKTASQWMQNCSVYVIVGFYTRTQVRSDEGECWHELERALKESPWKKRQGEKLVPHVLRPTRTPQYFYEIFVPDLKSSQLHALRQYMTGIARTLVALERWPMVRVDFSLEIRSETVQVTLEK